MAANEWTRERLAPIVASVITAIWAISFLSDVFTHYKQNPTITPLMLGVAGWLFGADMMKRRDGDAGKAEEEEAVT